MKIWLPRTLFGQLLLALCAGLVAAQLAGLWLVFDDRIRYGDGLLGTFAAPRVAGIATILDKTAPADRARLLHALSVPPTRFSLADVWGQPEANLGKEARDFAERFEQELDKPLVVQVLSIKPYDSYKRDEAQQIGNVQAPGPAVNGSGERAPGAIAPENLKRIKPGPRIAYVTGQFRLTDGSIVNFRHSVPQPQSDFPLRLFGLLSILGTTVALLAAWAVRRLTRPLQALSKAAVGLSQDLNQPALDESGPTEVANAAQAFNAMQRNIRNMVETRAQALAGVSHDLRLPITRLRLRLEKLPDDELRKKMDDDLAEMDVMINGTLEFLRAGNNSERCIPLDLNALLETMAEDMHDMGANVTIKGEAGAAIHSRPEALQRCIGNLLDNARRYGGNDIDVAVQDHVAQVQIDIMDRGPGIPETERERMFEPYVRLESSRARHTGGSGLGLAIARTFARSQGGDIVLSARPGGGLIASLRLCRHAP